jgi:protease II
MTDQQPPVAKRMPTERVHHDDLVLDEHAWLHDKDNPDTIGYLTANVLLGEVLPGPPDRDPAHHAAQP